MIEFVDLNLEISLILAILDIYEQFKFHEKSFETSGPDLSLVVRKTAFCNCKNKDADQPCGYCKADQHLCFRYTDSTIPLLPISEI